MVKMAFQGCLVSGFNLYRNSLFGKPPSLAIAKQILLVVVEPTNPEKKIPKAIKNVRLYATDFFPLATK